MSIIDELHERAVVATGGLSDFGDDDYLDGLGVLMEAVDSSPHAGDALRQRTAGMTTAVLVGRLSSQAGWTSRPDVRVQSLPPQVVIVGLPRSGTTALHQMLAADSQFQWIPNWLAWRPRVRPPRDQWADDPLHGAQVARYAQAGPNPLHDIGPDDPEECLMVMVQSFVSMMFVSSLPVPAYHQWFLAQDERPSFRRYADNLRLIGADAPEQPWLLKNPSHTFGMAALLETFPDARIVHIYRDPAASIVSGCSLITSTAGGPGSFTPEELGAHRLRTWALAAERMDAAREGHEERFVDVDYRDFVRDALAVGRNVYGALGIDFTPDVETAMRQWSEGRPKDRFGAHRYRAEDFGLSDAGIRERMHAYVDRYGTAVGADTS
jgi:hypothetical protein